MNEKWQYPGAGKSPPAASPYPPQPPWQCHLSRNLTSEPCRVLPLLLPLLLTSPLHLSHFPLYEWQVTSINSPATHICLATGQQPHRTSPGMIFSALAFPLKLSLPPKNLKKIFRVYTRSAYLLLKYCHHRGWKQKPRNSSLKHPSLISVMYLDMNTLSHIQQCTWKCGWRSISSSAISNIALTTESYNMKLVGFCKKSSSDRTHSLTPPSFSNLVSGAIDNFVGFLKSRRYIEAFSDFLAWFVHAGVVLSKYLILP